jgi:hypothetical protein
LVRAGLSTGRALLGSVHTVATLTATYLRFGDVALAARVLTLLVVWPATGAAAAAGLTADDAGTTTTVAATRVASALALEASPREVRCVLRWRMSFLPVPRIRSCLILPSPCTPVDDKRSLGESTSTTAVGSTTATPYATSTRSRPGPPDSRAPRPRA